MSSPIISLFQSFFLFVIEKVIIAHNINSTDARSNSSTSGEKKLIYILEKITSIHGENEAKLGQMNENGVLNHYAIYLYILS